MTRWARAVAAAGGCWHDAGYGIDASDLLLMPAVLALFVQAGGERVLHVVFCVIGVYAARGQTGRPLWREFAGTHLEYAAAGQRWLQLGFDSCYGSLLLCWCLGCARAGAAGVLRRKKARWVRAFERNKES